MSEKAFGWVIIDTVTNDRYSTGSWSSRSTKLYISKAKAEAALKLSLGRQYEEKAHEFKVRPLYLYPPLELR